MTSWERSRFIPWTHVSNVSAPEYETSKEHVYRSLNKEASKEKEQQTSSSLQRRKGEQNEFVPPEVQSQKKGKGLFKGVDYETPDLLRSMAFGGCIGSITGAVFGFMDGMRTAGESAILKNASNAAKGKCVPLFMEEEGTLFTSTSTV